MVSRTCRHMITVWRASLQISKFMYVYNMEFQMFTVYMFLSSQFFFNDFINVIDTRTICLSNNGKGHA